MRILHEHPFRVFKACFSVKRLLAYALMFAADSAWNLGFICVLVGGLVGASLYIIITMLFAIGLCGWYYIGINEMSDEEKREQALDELKAQSFIDIFKSRGAGED